MEVSDEVAREMGWTALQAWGNLVGVICSMAQEAGLPPEAISEFLRKLNDANEATISAPQGVQFLDEQLATLLQRFGPSGG
ncbi:MAG TPA: hypothetical protein VF503_08975 [Sphingobium sp.]|uniref:hypothetical protein n=1 Tax=Sphingobium sp. TaxID=1912891 RepID=UPI002ED49C06